MVKKSDVFFSIVVPVYNCEKFLKNTLDSIRLQTFEKFEVLLINDGSIDNSESICKEYSKNDKRFKFYEKVNSGVSDTRNFGINKSVGKFLIFLDADDYIDSNYLEEMNKIIKIHECDFISTGFYSEVENNEIKSFDRICAKERFYQNKNDLKEDLVYLWDSHMLYNVWNKVYSLEKIRENKLKFPNFNFGEDMWFNQQYLNFVDKYYNSEKCYYHYIKERKGSITAKFNPSLFELRKNEYYEFNKYFERQQLKENDYLEFSSRRYLERVLGCIENIYSSDLLQKEKNLKIKEIINDELTRKTLKIIKPKSLKIKIMLIPIKLKSTFITKSVFYFVSKVRETNPILFNKLKNRR